MRKARSVPLALALAAALLAPPPAARAATEIPVLTSSAGEFQPARSENAMAWEQNTRAQPNQYDVIVQVDGSAPVQANSSVSSAAMGDFIGDQLVYQQYKGNPYRRGRSDLFLFDVDSGTRSKVPGVNGRQWEYWPSHSDGWLLFGRWKPKKEVRRLFLHHLETGERRLLDKTKGKSRFIGPGQVQGNYAVWSTCRSRCNVFRYDIAASTKQMIDNPGSFQRAPSVSPGGTVYFSRGAKGCGASVALVRATPDGAQEVLVQLQKGLDIRDTYAYTEPNGSVEVYYERNACGTKAGSDIYKIRDTALVTLGVVKEGTGTVSSSPPGIACGADCVEDYEVGTEVTLTASADPGFVFVGWSGPCTGTGPCVVTMDEVTEVTATFLPLGSVTIKKEAIPEDPHDFEFDHNLGGGDFSLDDDPGSVLADTRTFTPGSPGDYFVEEKSALGWQLTGITCQDPDEGSSWNLSTRRATIDLDPNEAVQCTFTNTKSARIIVEKQTVPNGAPGNFTFTGDASGTVSDNGQITVSNLAPGSYSSTEASPTPGFDLTGISCDDLNSTGNLGTRTATFNLEAGETVKCTFTNTRQGSSITIEKQTTPPDSSQSFQFDPSYSSNFSLTDNGTNNSGPLAPGNYTVSEINIPSGWSVTGIDCVGGGPDTSGSGTTATIGLDAGETVTCTFNNTQQAPGSITIVKDAEPNDPRDWEFNPGASLDPGPNFFLDDDILSALPNQRTYSGLVAGTYSVSEVNIPTDWQMSSSCSDGSSPSNIQLGEGESVTCTFTNTKNGRIIVTKQTIPDGASGTFGFARDYGPNFSLSDGQSNDSGFTVEPGTHNVSENVPSGWDLTGQSCSDGSDPGAIDVSPGEMVTCTFTNTQRGTIVVEKQTVPNGSPGSFTFTGDASGTISDDGQITVSSLAPGAYSSTEADPTPIFDLTGISCDDANSSGNVGTRTATFNLEAGETVTCTFTNTLLPPPLRFGGRQA